jgi:ribosomal protein uL24
MKSFSKAWNSSSARKKQRKFRFQAPLHISGKFLNVHLDKALRTKYSTRAIRVITGDKVQIMRGSFKGKDGNYYTRRSIDPETFGLYFDGFWSKNKKNIKEEYNKLGKKSKAAMGPGEAGEKQYAKKMIETQLKIGTSSKANKSNSNGEGRKVLPTDYHRILIENNTEIEGVSPFTHELVPQENGLLTTDNVQTLNYDEDKKSYEIGTPLGIKIPQGLKVHLAGEKDEIISWRRDELGDLYAEVEVWVDEKDFENLDVKKTNSITNFLNKLPTVETENYKTGTPTIRADAREKKEVYNRELNTTTFKIWVKLSESGQDIINYNKKMNEYYSPKIVPNKEGDEKEVEKETKEETEGAIDTSKYNTE